MKMCEKDDSITLTPEEFLKDIKKYADSEKLIIINGNLDLYGRSDDDVEKLPKRLYIKENKDRKEKGELNLEHCFGLKRGPEELQVDDSVDFGYCLHLENAPKRLKAGGYVDFYNTDAQIYPFSEWEIGGLFYFGGASRASLPDIVRAYSLDVVECDQLQKLSSIKVKKDVEIRGCSNLMDLKFLDVGGSLLIDDCESLEVISFGVTAENIEIINCPKLMEPYVDY